MFQRLYISHGNLVALIASLLFQLFVPSSGHCNISILYSPTMLCDDLQISHCNFLQWGSCFSGAVVLDSTVSDGKSRDESCINRGLGPEGNDTMRRLARYEKLSDTYPLGVLRRERNGVCSRSTVHRSPTVHQLTTSRVDFRFHTHVWHGMSVPRSFSLSLFHINLAVIVGMFL